PGMSVRALTLPVMITQLCIPIAFAGDRLILSHVSTEYQVSKYSLLLQIFVPITGLIVAAAQPLWPMFTRARVNGEGMPRMRLILVAFVVGTALVSLVLVIISPPLGKAISGGEIDLGYALPALTAVVACMQALVVPMSMGMVDPKGVRFVAIWSVIAVPVSLVVSIWFASMWGATGVMLSAAFVGGSVQLIPIAIYSVRRSRQAEPVDLF
ncbi:MAG: lipopolysaccharide biosynthesis protein, partial [Marmoricola sp.]